MAASSYEAVIWCLDFRQARRPEDKRSPMSASAQWLERIEPGRGRPLEGGRVPVSVRLLQVRKRLAVAGIEQERPPEAAAGRSQLATLPPGDAAVDV